MKKFFQREYIFLRRSLNLPSRLFLVLAAVCVVAAVFLPLWQIRLVAPQYAEGLRIEIYAHKLVGGNHGQDLQEINGLNHYIGMKHIKAEMFPEFSFLVYILGFFVLFGLAIAISGSRKLLFVYLIFSVIGGAAALADFYMWGYDYGHNLDPTAAIQVPGLSYQPPVIGHKKLLNFDSYSYPDTGGWVVVGVTALFFIVWFIEWRKRKKQKTMISRKMTAVAATFVSVLILAGCNPKSEKISFGKDNCAECKMTIMDPKFGGEIVTKKGKVYKFDDVHCVAMFLKRRGVEMNEIHQTLFTDYNNSEEFIKVNSAEFVVSSQLKSPMGGNAAAFKNSTEAQSKSAEIEGSKITNWATLYNILIK